MKRHVAYVILALMSCPLVAQVVVEPILKRAGAHGEKLELYWRKSNATARAVKITVQYAYTCFDGRNGVAAKTFDGVFANRSEEWPDSSVCYGYDGPKQVNVLHMRWQLADFEVAMDEEKARRGQQQRDEEQRRRATCRIDEGGRFDLAQVAFGKVPMQCKNWFPQLGRAIVQYEAAERQRVEAELNRRTRVHEEGARVKSETARLEAARRLAIAQDRQERQKLEDEARTARAMQERQQQAARLESEQAARYRSDPCGAVGDMQSRPPHPSPYPPNATPPVRAATDKFNAQKMAQWTHALEQQRRACQMASAARAMPPPTGAPAVPSPSAEAQRMQQAVARADLARVNADARENLKSEAAKTQALADDNAALRELLNR